MFLSGPPAKAMWALGDKIASSIVAQTLDIPTLAWSGSGLRVTWTEEDMRRGKKIVVPRDLYNRACITTAEEGLMVCAFSRLVVRHNTEDFRF